MLSINDRPEIRKLSSGFMLEAVATPYAIRGGRGGIWPAAGLTIIGGSQAG